MKFLTNRISWGLLLIAGGVLFLLQNLALLPESAPLWAVIFGAGGLYFIAVFFSGSGYWWAAFPGFAMIGLSAAVYIAELSRIPDEAAGAAFLGMASLSFFAIYLRTRMHWWPLIPAGALLSLTGVVVVEMLNAPFSDELIPVVLFGGLALTFFIIYIAPSDAARARWAVWPAVALLGIGLIAGAGTFQLMNFVLPILLIALGAAILLRSFSGRG